MAFGTRTGFLIPFLPVCTVAESLTGSSDLGRVPPGT